MEATEPKLSVTQNHWQLVASLPTQEGSQDFMDSIRKVLRNPSYFPSMLQRKVVGLWRKSCYEELFKYLDESLIGDVKLRVPELDGVFQVSPRSHLFQRLLLHREYEPEIARLVRRFIDPARDMIDIGANIGFFTVFGARFLTIGKVLAIEPTSGALKRLVSNATLNGVSDRVIVFNGAVSSEPGELTLNVLPDREEYSSLSQIVHPAVSGEATIPEKVSISTVDLLVAQYGLNPALMKVDVEGYEERVFRGARNTLTKFRPVVISELNNAMLMKLGTNALEVVSQFNQLGYTVTNPNAPGAAPGVDEFGEILCVPAELT